MKKLILIAAAAACLCACGNAPTMVVDQKLRHEYFIECMQKLPKGPAQTKYNDWDEVVEACSSSAYYLSLRMSDGSTVLPR